MEIGLSFFGGARLSVTGSDSADGSLVNVPGRVHQNNAFSLVELLVGLAILTILTVLLATAFSNFSQVTSSSGSRIDTSKQTRTIFDRIAFDLGSAVRHGRVQIAFRKNSALTGGSPSKNDVMVLLTDANTTDPSARFAKIGYAVGPCEDRARGTTVNTLLRHVEPFTWEDDTTVIDIAGDANAQPIAPGIVRFELAFVDRNGAIIAEPPGPGATEEELRAFNKDLSAIICALATMDEESLARLTDEDRDALADRLDDAVNGEAPLVRWQAVDLQDFPQPARESLRFHQRYFRLK